MTSGRHYFFASCAWILLAPPAIRWGFGLDTKEAGAVALLSIAIALCLRRHE